MHYPSHEILLLAGAVLNERSLDADIACKHVGRIRKGSQFLHRAMAGESDVC